MGKIYKAEEWQDEVGNWHCGDTSHLARNSNAWYHGARILGIPPADFLKKIIKEFKPNNVYYSSDFSFVGWSWKSQSQMRKYKNWINAAARAAKYEV
jgi:hypothetical protein